MPAAQKRNRKAMQSEDTSRKNAMREPTTDGNYEEKNVPDRKKTTTRSQPNSVIHLFSFRLLNLLIINIMLVFVRLNFFCPWISVSSN